MLCDRCGEPGAETYSVTIGDSRWSVELCETHAKPLLAAAKLGRQADGTDTRKGLTSAARTLDGLIRNPPDTP